MSKLINSDLSTAGIHRVKVFENEGKIRVYIPGLSQINPYDTNGNLIEDIVDKNISAFPEAQWCAYNLQSCDIANISEPMWCMFEGGDVKRPVIMSYTFIGAGSNGVLDGDIGLDGGSAEQNALKIYYLYDALGVPKINISGILGNYEVECSIDPTTIETIYDEKYTMGPKKQKAQSDWNSFTLNTVFPLYEGSVSINKGAYKATDGKYYPGIAINSATGEGARKLLEYAKTKNMSWFNIELQLMFNLTFTGTKGVPQYTFMTQTWNKEEPSASSAAIRYGQNYEHGGISPNASGILNSAKRESAAAQWYNKMGSWTPNLKYGYALIKKAGFTAPTQAKNFSQSDWDSASDSDIVINVSGSTGGNQGIVLSAKKYLGKPYEWGAIGPNSFDCSGLTWKVYKENGKDIPRTAGEQFKQCTKVSKENLSPGDLVFTLGANGTSTSPGHVGIYIGNGRMIHAPTTGKNVMEQDITTGYYNRTFVSGGRY